MQNKRHSKRPGFTFLELIIYISIITLILGMGLGRFRRSARYEREAFVAQLNELLFLGWQQAIRTTKLHRITCDLGKRIMTVATATDIIDTQTGELVFERVKSRYGVSSLVIPKHIKVVNFFIEGYDEMQKYQTKSATIWFFLTPDGLAQEVTINAMDTQDLVDKKPRHFSLVLNPFTAQFDTHDSFQK